MWIILLLFHAILTSQAIVFCISAAGQYTLKLLPSDVILNMSQCIRTGLRHNAILITSPCIPNYVTISLNVTIIACSHGQQQSRVIFNPSPFSDSLQTLYMPLELRRHGVLQTLSFENGTRAINDSNTPGSRTCLLGVPYRAPVTELYGCLQAMAKGKVWCYKSYVDWPYSGNSTHHVPTLACWSPQNQHISLS